MRERNHTFDLLCGICILRMMANHSMGLCGQAQPWWTGTMDWTFYFMCFFFFKAGYFNKTVSGDTRAFVRRKSLQLLVPYAVWGAIGSVIYFALQPFVVARYHHMVDKLTWAHLWNTSGFWGNPPCWFLLSFWAAYVVVHLLEKVKKLHWIALAFPFLSWWLWSLGNPLPLSLGNVPMGVFFFFLGHIWHWFLGRYRHRWAMVLSVVMLLAFVVMQWRFGAGYTMSTNTWVGNPVAVTLETAFALCGLSGVLLSLPQRRVPVISYFGEHSMVYFVTHYIIIIIYKYVHLSQGHGIWGRSEEVVILYATLLCICTWLVPYIERLPWLSGRFRT